MFEAQVKLEPRQKLELARELGLQPRQVAIWFQNKRARWKSKQLEREYRALKTEYDALLASFESLKKEKQILLAQLQTLEELLDKAEERSPDGGDAATKNEERPRLLLKEEPELELAGSADEEDKNLNYLSEEEAALGQPASSSLTLPAAEQQFCFTTSSWPSDQSGGHSHWWEFWPPRG
ncbi:hypothetical protein Cni_G06906 [Canna indica]|uniref:Homeobox-leucine zipper protein n=1 Tax=Canna indica TaxID=4628 RepID=A0AAQ3JY69_9LILI|nr:hypothetical protein Cni_G06906 [Canna indica]